MKEFEQIQQEMRLKALSTAIWLALYHAEQTHEGDLINAMMHAQMLLMRYKRDLLVKAAEAQIAKEEKAAEEI
jgi:hypothetical protein